MPEGSGQAASAGGRLIVRYNGGGNHTVWQNTVPVNGSQPASGSFTPPDGTFQVGTAVVLDKGHLTFSDVTLSVLSDPITPITARSGQLHDLAAQVSGVRSRPCWGRVVRCW